MFTWITAGDVDLRFSREFLRKAKAVDEETTCASRLYHQRNQSMHMTDGVTVMSLSAATKRLYQILVNQELSCTFEKWRKFSDHVKVKSHKKETAKNDTCLYFNI
jgi:hypothetical protein